MRRGRFGWMVSVVLAVVAVGCTTESRGTAIPDAESRPEGAARVVKVDRDVPAGVRLELEGDIVLTLGTPGTRTPIETASGPESLAVYGHDTRGLWVLWLGPEPELGPDCFALRKIGYDRPGFIGWPGDGFALPKAADFQVGSGVFLDRDPASRTFGWYTSGGPSGGSATFCVSSRGEVTSVSN